MHRAYGSRRRLGCSFFVRLRRRFWTHGFGSSGRLSANGLDRSMCNLRCGRFGCGELFGAGRAVSARQPAPEFKHDAVVQRTRMRFLVRNAEFGQQVQDDVGLDL
jgi:hypothetical protein